MKENFNYDENMDTDNIIITPLYDDEDDVSTMNQEYLDDSIQHEEQFHIENDTDSLSDSRRKIKKTSESSLVDEESGYSDNTDKDTKDNVSTDDASKDNVSTDNASKDDVSTDDAAEYDSFKIDDLYMDDVSGYQFRDVVSEQIVASDNKGIEELEDKNMLNEDVDFDFDDIAPYISKNNKVTDINDKKSKKASKKDKDKLDKKASKKNNDKVKKKSKFKRLPKWAQVACIVLICLAFVAGGSTVAYNTVLASLVNFKDFTAVEEQEEQFDTEETISDTEDIEVVEAEDFNWDIINGNSKYDPNIYNILIIGGDNASTTGYRGNSDTLIIVSIDKNTKKIKLSSIMRDTYVPIPNHSANKINSAFATGGVPLTKQTIEDNFKITIDSTVVINYTTFRKVIDKLGGVDDVTINEREANFINSQCRKKGHSSNLSAGTVHLNAVQALNFARIRKINSDIYGHDDFGRTARQRFIMNQLFKKYKDLSYTELAQLATVVLGELEVDKALKKDMFLLLQVVLKFETDKLEEFRLPVDDGYSFAGVPIPGSGRTMSVVKIDDYWQKNVDALHMFIYGDVDYEK